MRSGKTSAGRKRSCRPSRLLWVRIGSRSRGANARVCCFISVPWGTGGAGKTGCRSHPWALQQKAQDHRRNRRNPACPARWATACFVLSPARPRLFVAAPAKTLAGFAGRHLRPGRRAHTTSPSAPRAVVDRALGVHRISTHVRDNREAHLAELPVGLFCRTNGLARSWRTTRAARDHPVQRELIQAIGWGKHQ
ncbi:hypothetical protein ABIF29_005116 [Bradyrhizobium elkanii]|uniref:Uncharacterized protein n=1 Tax=Bradyrhizobium elkanii TaxID=29448 RepID=A0A8I2C5S1_BRAEL|nr:hypothetical protein [Bradyrhizobium elkanii]MCP1749884.1 hypothetical protein [Bradyrhizobium elkanii]MCP1984458.1 hypothetical protein [Bradyrhizobium elkanii]MCS3692859.1 hypothetical protein [Bradyrhizobium elkanii]MCS3889823.1 hypothetical protein [Bradyrhizobium elkanii]